MCFAQSTLEHLGIVWNLTINTCYFHNITVKNKARYIFT